MGHFNRDDNRSGGGFNRGFGGGGRKFGRRDGGRPTMHQATCSECNASCEIPFRPSGDRPVFCSTCFEKQGGGTRPSRFDGDRGGRGERHERHRDEDRQMYEAVCAKCSKACQVPFMPKADKPVFCDACFSNGGKGGQNSGELMEQIKMLNAKVDKLMKFLNPKGSEEKAEKIEVEKEVSEKTEVKKEAKKSKKGGNKAIVKKETKKKKK